MGTSSFCASCTMHSKEKQRGWNGSDEITSIKEYFTEYNGGGYSFENPICLLAPFMLSFSNISHVLICMRNISCQHLLWQWYHVAVKMQSWIFCTSRKSNLTLFPRAAHQVTLSAESWQAGPTVNIVFWQPIKHSRWRETLAMQVDPECRWFLMTEWRALVLFIPRSPGVQGISLPLETSLALTRPPRFQGLIHLRH